MRASRGSGAETDAINVLTRVCMSLMSMLSLNVMLPSPRLVNSFARNSKLIIYSEGNLTLLPLTKKYSPTSSTDMAPSTLIRRLTIVVNLLIEETTATFAASCICADLKITARLLTTSFACF